MTRKELFKKLNNLCEDMNLYYNINCGGCCYVAAVISEQLETFNIPFKIAVTYSPTHYAIKVNDRFINRDGFRFLEEDIIDNWSSKYLYALYDSQDWNDYYSKRWNLIVRTRIKSLFKKYENSRK